MHPRWRWKHCFVGGVLLTCTFSSWWVPFHMANLIQRFQPTVHIFGQQQQSQPEEPQQNDDGDARNNNSTLGTKSCAWNGRTWKCRHCNVKKNGLPVQCRRLKRRRDAATNAGRQHDFCSHPVSSNGPARDKDPQVHLYANGDRTLNIRNNKYVYHHQPPCQVENCWDLSRCRRDMVRLVAEDDNDGAALASSSRASSSAALTLYINGSASDELIDYAIKHSKYPLVRVEDYRAACLTIVFPSTYRTFQQLLSSLHWRQPSPLLPPQQHASTTSTGQNHLLWQYSRFGYEPRLTADNAFQQFDVGQAAVASEALEHGYLRAGYDMALPLPTKFWPKKQQQQQRPDINNNNVTAMNVTTTRRPLLVQFRGVVQTTDQVGYHHRWLAGTYWEEDADDVAVDIQCVQKHWRTRELKVTKPYDFPSTMYREWMEQSVYSFAPGGSGPGSYRFGEILYAGGIPIVTDNFVPPFFPEVDWSKCLLVVSSASDIVNLPARLRRNYEYYHNETALQQRRAACATLFHAVMGTSEKQSDERVTLTKALEIWFLRVQHALEYETTI
jgi:Exostosin family